MTNNNNNLPPIEEIREIKEEYQIPSFEEFMKNYKSDEKVESIYELEYQNQALHGPQYGPGLFGDIVKGVSAVALTASYFTPLGIVTVPATVGAATWGVAVQAGGGDPEYGEAGKHVTDVATAAAVNTASVVLVPAIAGNNVDKAVKTVAKKFV